LVSIHFLAVKGCQEPFCLGSKRVSGTFLPATATTGPSV
jgi:hypothetical protein